MSRDDAYLLDMLIAARQVAKYASEVSESDFRENRLYQDAIIRELEIVGEAARHVSLACAAEPQNVGRTKRWTD